jgi:hypothetical protein
LLGHPWRVKIGSIIRKPPPFAALKLCEASNPSAILVKKLFFLDLTKTPYLGAVVPSDPKLAVYADICDRPPIST